MLIRDLLEAGKCPPAVTIGPDAPVLDAAGQLRSTGSTSLLVMVGDRVVGTLSETDLVAAVAERGATIALLTVGEVMDQHVVTCGIDDDVNETLDRMGSAAVHSVPVIVAGRPLTLLTSREFETACRFLKVQADTDDLTGLANRRSFLKSVDEEFNRYTRHRTPMAVAMMDLDLFKTINDRLGHAEGDRLLQAVARTLASGLRSFDRVARIGGDEFAVLFPQTRLSEAVLACQRLTAACAELPLPRIDGVFRLGLSCGVTVAAHSDRETSTILQRADQSLYRAKKSGRGKVVAARTAVPGQLMSA